MRVIFKTFVLVATLIQPASAMQKSSIETIQKITIDKEKLISLFSKHNIQDLKTTTLIDNLSQANSHPATIVMSIYFAVWTCSDHYSYSDDLQEDLEDKIYTVVCEALADQPIAIKAIEEAKNTLSFRGK